MDDEKLIDLVRKYEFLYNLKHPKYMDTTRKEIAWKDIADHLQQSAAACKERWQNLRDAYRRALTKKKMKSGLASHTSKPWKYENEMAFVVPFFVKRKTLESIEKSEGEESDNCADEQNNFMDPYHHSILPYYMKNETQDPVEVKMEGDDSDNCTDELTIDTQNVNNYHSENIVQKNRSRGTKRKLNESEKAVSTALSKLITDRSTADTPREHNELDLFFLTVSDTVKKFSPYIQAVAKNKIFNLVSEMELQLLRPASTSSSSQ